jgi:hypothetical protein
LLLALERHVVGGIEDAQHQRSGARVAEVTNTTWMQPTMAAASLGIE